MSLHLVLLMGRNEGCSVRASKGQTQGRGSRCAQSVVIDYPDSCCDVWLQFVNLSINKYFLNNSFL